MKKREFSHYNLFLIMVVVHFIAMYILMYAMVNNFSNVFSNLNQFYMAGLMTSSMIFIEISLMRFMYKNKKLNLIIFVIGVVLLLLFFMAIRQQNAISDKEFLKSMIPHHAGAILMCDNPEIKDPEIIDLCANITSSQQTEIDWMKLKLKELK